MSERDPWEQGYAPADELPYVGIRYATEVYDSCGCLVCDCDEQPDDAAQIVREHNTYPSLIAQLERLTRIEAAARAYLAAFDAGDTMAHAERDELRKAVTGDDTVTTHYLKCWPVYFGLVLSGAKQFELRKNDRNYQVGDVLILEEWDQTAEVYTGARCRRVISCIVSDGPWLAPGYVALGLREE